MHCDPRPAAHVGSGISACDRKRFVPEGLGGIPSTSVSLSPRQTLTESAICSRRYKALDPRCSNSSEDCGSCDASSTTTRKTLESLTSSIYDELAPFRSAHEDLIKVQCRNHSHGDLCGHGGTLVVPFSCAVSENRGIFVSSPSFSLLSSASEQNRIARKRRASSIIWKGPKDSKASKNRDPLESGLGKIALHAFSFGWDDGKVSVSGFQASGYEDARGRHCYGTYFLNVSCLDENQLQAPVIITTSTLLASVNLQHGAFASNPMTCTFAPVNDEHSKTEIDRPC